MHSRREVRERVLQALYAYEVGHDTAEHVIDTVLRPVLKDDREVLRFATQLFLRTINLSEEADRLIADHVKKLGPDAHCADRPAAAAHGHLRIACV